MIISFGITPALTILISRGATAAVGLALACVLLGHLVGRIFAPQRTRTMHEWAADLTLPIASAGGRVLLALLLVFLGYALASAVLSEGDWTAVLAAILATVAWFPLRDACAGVSTGELRAVILAGLSIAIVFLVFDLSGTTALHSLIDPRTDLHDLNRAQFIVAANAFVLLRLVSDRGGADVPAMLVLAFAAFVIGFGTGQSVQLGVLAAIAVTAVCNANLQRAAFGVMVLGFLALPFLSVSLFHATFVSGEVAPGWWQSSNAWLRLAIWAGYATQIEGHLLFGQGFGAAEAMGRTGEVGRFLGFYSIEERAIVYPHSLSLRTVVDLGLLGSGLVGAFWLAVASVTTRWRTRERLPVVALCTLVYVYAMIATNLFQGWALAVLCAATAGAAAWAPAKIENTSPRDDADRGRPDPDVEPEPTSGHS